MSCTKTSLEPSEDTMGFSNNFTDKVRLPYNKTLELSNESPNPKSSKVLLGKLSEKTNDLKYAFINSKGGITYESANFYDKGLGKAKMFSFS